MDIQNILNIYDLANKAEIVDGLQWYKNANDICRDIASDTDLQLHVVVGVMAALSPSNKWDRNIIDCKQVIAAFQRGDSVESVKTCTYNNMKLKAWRILTEQGDVDNVATILNGAKITDFYHCILGHNVCVIDGHAYGIAFNQRLSMKAVPNIGKKLRRELQEVYIAAAKQRGIKAYEMQAVTWVVWRRIHGVV